MNRPALSCVLAAMVVLARPLPASADITAFLGLGTSPTTRATRGFSAGISLLVVGFEVEYGRTVEDADTGAPGLTTTMFQGLVVTPTRAQLYLTAGGGVYRERTGTQTETHVATSFGGGLKLPLAGPIRLRLDYRVFDLRGTPRFRNPQRFYAGINIPF
jgi:hypothetical protein